MIHSHYHLFWFLFVLKNLYIALSIDEWMYWKKGRILFGDQEVVEFLCYILLEDKFIIGVSWGIQDGADLDSKLPSFQCVDWESMCDSVSLEVDYNCILHELCITMVLEIFSCQFIALQLMKYVEHLMENGLSDAYYQHCSRVLLLCLNHKNQHYELLSFCFFLFFPLLPFLTQAFQGDRFVCFK